MFKTKVYDFYNEETGESVSHRAENETQKDIIFNLFYVLYEPYGFEIFEGKGIEEAE